MIKVSIALPTYNRASFLEDCISNVLLQSFDDYELIVIDDGSTDETAKIMGKLANLDPRIRFYKNDINKGLPYSRNKAIFLSRGDFIFFIEDDLKLSPDCLSKLYKTFNKLIERGIKVGAVGPRLIDVFSKDFVKKSKDIVKISKFTGHINSNFNIDKVTEVEVPTLHACCLISKNVFRDVGCYDHNLYRGTFYREETDLYFRAIREGYKLYYQSNAISFHRNISSGGCSSLPFRTIYYSVKNHILFLVRFYGLRTFMMIPCYLVSLVSFIKNYKNYI